MLRTHVSNRKHDDLQIIRHARTRPSFERVEVLRGARGPLYRALLHGWVRVRAPQRRVALLHPSIRRFVSRVSSYSSDFQSLFRLRRLSLSRTERGVGVPSFMQMHFGWAKHRL